MPIDEQLAKMLASDDANKRTIELLRSVTGIGPVTISTVIAKLPELCETQMNFRAYALKIPGIGAGPKYTLADQLATKKKSKNSQVFDSALANNYHRRSPPELVVPQILGFRNTFGSASITEPTKVQPAPCALTQPANKNVPTNPRLGGTVGSRGSSLMAATPKGDLTLSYLFESTVLPRSTVLLCVMCVAQHSRIQPVD